jgi:hypothetical protein
MPNFTINVCQGKFSRSSIETACESVAAARLEAVAMFADLARDILGGPAFNSEWRMEVGDESGQPIFRLMLSAACL